MTSLRDHPERIRAELEERLLREMKEFFDELELPAGRRRELARDIVEAARVGAVNRTAAAWALAYDREVGPYKYGVRVQLIEEGRLEPTATDMHWARAQDFDELARARWQADDRAGAEPFLLKAQPLFEKSGDEQAVATCLMNLAWTEIDRGYFDDARPRLERAAEIMSRLGHQEQTARAMAYLGRLAAHSGDKEAAREWWMKALARYNNAGQRDGKEAQEVIELLGSS